MSVAKRRQNVTSGNLKNLIITLGLLLCLVVSIVSLYPALRSYYLASRVNEQLLHELVAVEERNGQILDQIASLNTREGIADRARERFGWVAAGEQAVNITGLHVSDSTTVLPAPVASGSIAAPDTWWTDFLDALFAVTEAEAPEPIPDPFISDFE